MLVGFFKKTVIKEQGSGVVVVLVKSYIYKITAHKSQNLKFGVGSRIPIIGPVHWQ